MKNFEKVAAYFENELGESEKQNLLKELETNPELKSEFNFQQQVIEGIKEARKAELKAMLNNVPIASVGTSSFSSIFKVIIGGAVTILVGSGVYWYYFSSNTPSESVREPVSIEYVDKSEPVNEKDILKTPETSDKVEDDKVKSDMKEDISNNSKVSKQESSETTIAKTPKMPSAADDNFATQTLPEENLDIPKTVSEASVNISSKVDVEVRMKKKYNFHYQFNSGKLILYGDRKAHV